ncbi:hypothetical protein QQ045_013612 [Rhodiola kirilowii]
MDIWKLIWSMKSPAKLKYFAWRACSGVLPTKDEFNRRHIIDSVLCDRCRGDSESVWHLFILCPETDISWTVSSLLSWARSINFKNLVEAVMLLNGDGRLAVRDFFVHCWICWTWRNNCIFKPGFINGDVVRT